MLNERRVILGGAASILLIISLFFLPWYELAENPQREIGAPDAFICGTGEYSCTGWETFPILRWLLLAAAFAPLILGWILVRGHKLSWAPGEVTMVVGFTAFILILYNGLIDRPGSQIAEAGVSLTYGYFVALLGDRADGGDGIPALAGERRQEAAQSAGHRLVGVISHDVRSGSKPDRNLALELVRVTEAAALAAARWVGKGAKEDADQAAVDAMRLMLDTVPMDGIVVIGEGEKDEAPMLFNGEEIGDGSPPKVDIAVDPLEGTTLTARGMPSALAVIALAERGTMFDPGPCVYMEKLAGSPAIADCLSLDDSLSDVVRNVAEKKGTTPGDVTVIMLDRERHAEGVEELREVGARIRFISDGDVSAAMIAVTEGSGVDLLWGIGGTPEGVLSAAAIKSLGGQLLGRLWPRTDEERKEAVDAGYDLDRVLNVDDLISGDDVFFAATGVTDGDTLQGVRYVSGGRATTESLVMRSRSGTVREVKARHDRAKLREVVGERYG